MDEAMSEIIQTPIMELSSLKVCIRSYRACIKKLGSAKTQQQRSYWSSACQHWDGQMAMHLLDKDPNVTAQTIIDQFTQNINFLRKQVDPLICDDLLYRLDVIVKTLVNDEKQRVLD